MCMGALGAARLAKKATNYKYIYHIIPIHRLTERICLYIFICMFSIHKSQIISNRAPIYNMTERNAISRKSSNKSISGQRARQDIIDER